MIQNSAGRVRAVLVPVLILAVAVVAFVALRPGSGSESAATPLAMGPVIARVDGQPIYLHEAEARVDGLKTVHGSIQDVLGEDWHDVVLQSLVDDRILRERAQTLGITITDADISASLDKIEGTLGSDRSLEAWLAEQRMSLQELERRIELQLIGNRVFLAVTKDVHVTAAKLRHYYRTHTEEFTNGDGSVSSLLEVRRSLRKSMLQDDQERAYADWLQRQRDHVGVDVVRDDWWKGLA